MYTFIQPGFQTGGRKQHNLLNATDNSCDKFDS